LSEFRVIARFWQARNGYTNKDRHVIAERQSARMSNITNEGLTRSDTGAL